jgi:Stringent starvation protein B
MSDAPRQPPPKKDVALALLEESSVFIHLDPRRPDVVVPRSFMGQPQLVLQVGLNMAIPIPDLKLDDLYITCTLSFNQRPFWCRIPWTAVYALVGEDGRGGVWADDVPPEIQLQKQQQAKPSPAKRPRPRLAAVAGGAAPERARPAATEGSSEAGPEERAQGEAAGGSERPEPERLRRIPRAVPDLPRDEPPPDEPQPADTPVRPAPSSNGKKPKREIPPWLRVIK